MNKILVLIFCLNYTFSQNLKGKIYDQNQNNISNAYVLLNSGKLQYSKTDANGLFEFKNIEPNANIFFEINALGFETYTTSFIFKKDTTLIINLEKSTELIKEVIIKKEVGFITKKDTTKYSIDKYKDGSEKVIEDLLKKLPGIDVDKTGKISFKGKEIESLMFDGDDLFDVNYRVGSKNIDVDLIDGVEAIENFNDNKVLKNLTDSNKVALNLKVKKTVTRYSLNTDSKTDFQDKYNSVNTGIMMSSKLKFYNLLSFNNVGIDNSPFFLFVKNSEYESSNIQRIKSRNVISEGSVPLTLGNENALLNNNINFTNTFLKRFNKNSKNTFELVYFEDKITQDYKTNSSFSNGVNTNFTQNIILKPTIYNFSNRYEYNTSKLYIENKTLFEINNNNFINKINNNDLVNRSNLNTDKLFLANKTEISTTINKKSALNSIVFLSNFRNSQSLNFETPIDFVDGFQIQNQFFDLNTINLNLINEYYFSKNKFKVKISNNLFVNEDKMFSNTNVSSNLFNNDLTFSTFKNDMNFEFIYKFKKIFVKFNPIYNFTSLKSNNESLNVKSLLLSSSLRYIISKKIDINAIFRQDVNTPDVNFLYNNFIVQDFRSLSVNNLNLNILKSDNFNFNIRYSNYLNSIQSQLGFSYQNKINDFQNFNTINQNFLVNRNLILNFNNKMFSTFFYIHKYLVFLKSNLKFNVNYNVLNSSVYLSSSLIPFKNYQVSFKLEASTAFKAKVNFTNSLFFSSNKQLLELDNNKAFLRQFNNEFKIIYLINKNSNLNIIYSYFKPNFDRNEDYSFLNFYYEKKIYKDKINLSLTAHNLLNVKMFENSNIFSQGFSNYSYSLISRYVLFGVSYKII